jgi:hypothetical protein
MDYRIESFKKRFKSAKSHLNVQDIQEIVSFKNRDDVASVLREKFIAKDGPM